MRDSRLLLSAALGAAVALGGCPDPTTVDPPPTLTFGEAAHHETAAFLSVGGTGPDDVWLVGAQPNPKAPPVALHWDGAAWDVVDTGARHPLWWVHAFEGGPAFLAGGGATVLRVEDGVVTRTPTPEFFGHTVFGVWGPAPNELWAVGGFAGRAGFIWRWDGQAWSDVPLPADLPRQANGEIPALFKVWGRGADDVWAVGGAGTILHYDGQRWSVVPSGTTQQLFTVTGTADEVVIVGGAGTGVVLRGGVDGFTDDTPGGAPLLQGVAVDQRGTIYVAGAGGYAARTYPGGRWEAVDLNLPTSPHSIHALWADAGGDLWAVGGNVLAPPLHKGVSCTSAALPGDVWEPEPTTDPVAECPAAAIDPVPTGSIARRWSEQLLNSIRRDIPHPPKHARNLLHVSVAMYDAWAAYHDVPVGVVSDEDHTASDPADVDVAISYAALRVLEHRYATAVGAGVSLDCYARFMDVLGLDPDDRDAVGDDPVAVGNRIGFAVIERFADDGANEANGYADTTGWEADNPVMIVDRLGTNVEEPDVWQQLNLGTAETQNGIVLDTAIQPYVGAHWREVEPFAITRDPDTGLYGETFDAVPTVADPGLVDQVVEMIQKNAELDIADGVVWDIGPKGRGNNTLGTNDGAGYAENPVTGEPYAENRVLRGDFTRVIAEFWADGPTSETPPGHWTVLANEVSDEIDAADLRPFGVGSPVDRLSWDVGILLAVTSASHDAAITAWELKRESLGARPITLVRWMAQNGQRTDPTLASYHEDGLPLVPGLIEVITAESAAEGERHHHLRWYEGEIAVRGWHGEPGDRVSDHTPVTWMRALDWIPYQRRTFVTPAFPGFTSGHSTFSRAAAEALAAYTGSPWFPGGFHEWVAPADAYLVFENGPSADVRLQWASYYDAADQAGQSRLWGGIHVWADDWVGRTNGAAVGMATSERVRQHLFGEITER